MLHYMPLVCSVTYSDLWLLKAGGRHGHILQYKGTEYVCGQYLVIMQMCVGVMVMTYRV